MSTDSMDLSRVMLKRRRTKIVASRAFRSAHVEHRQVVGPLGVVE
jgi:hypothetical protein